MWTDNAQFNAVWHLLLELDPSEWLANRTKQKVQLARYGKLGRPEEGLGWSDVDARELQRVYRALTEVLKDEEGAGTTED